MVLTGGSGRRAGRDGSRDGEQRGANTQEHGVSDPARSFGPPGAPLVRPATLEDRSAVWAVHTAAIRRLCATHYSPDQVERWASFLTPDRYSAVISDPRRRFVVAEVAGVVVGFGQLDPAAGEVEAVYVDPDWAGRGVGGLLLRHLERLALSAGSRDLRLTATLNAVPFYEHHGFRVTGRGTVAHPSGVSLECAQMSKGAGGVSGPREAAG